MWPRPNSWLWCRCGRCLWTPENQSSARSLYRSRPAAVKQWCRPTPTFIATPCIWHCMHCKARYCRGKLSLRLSVTLLQSWSMNISVFLWQISQTWIAYKSSDVTRNFTLGGLKPNRTNTFPSPFPPFPLPFLLASLPSHSLEVRPLKIARGSGGAL